VLNKRRFAYSFKKALKKGCYIGIKPFILQVVARKKRLVLANTFILICYNNRKEAFKAFKRASSRFITIVSSILIKYFSIILTKAFIAYI
jgi:hypothetical protein